MLKNITLKTIGYFLIVSGLFMFFLNISLTSKLMEINDNACASSCSSEMLFCPYKHEFPIESVVISLISFALVSIGVYLYLLFGEVTPKEVQKKKDYSKVIENLQGDERKVLEILLERKGIYQSELKEITGFSKVKITRILDKLESRDVIERRRRGLTNFIILKQE